MGLGRICVHKVKGHVKVYFLCLPSNTSDIMTVIMHFVSEIVSNRDRYITAKNVPEAESKQKRMVLIKVLK